MNVLEGLEVAIELLDNSIYEAESGDDVEGHNYYQEACEAVKSVYLQIRSRSEE